MVVSVVSQLLECCANISGGARDDNDSKKESPFNIFSALKIVFVKKVASS